MSTRKKAPIVSKKGKNHGSPPKSRSSKSNPSPRLRPDALGMDNLCLKDRIAESERQYFAGVMKRRSMRSTYDRDWGDTIVDQRLSDDPGPINSGRFKPVKRWLVAYRTQESGADGTVNVTVTNIRTAISGTGSTTIQQFIVHEYHVWIAPNTPSTHFSGVLFTKDDEANGILGGQYSDIAPWGEFVKFRVRFKGEGQVCDATTSGNQELIGLGGSEKWNGLIYALVSTYD